MSSLFSGRHGITHRRLASILSIALILPALALIAGCPGGTEPSDVVSGTCMVGEDTVSGKVVFVGAGKEYQGPILDGKYKVDNVPKGKYKVFIESVGFVGAGGVAPMPADKFEKPKDMPTQKKMGVPPPDKYKSVDTSGLEIDVAGGRQKWDIKLTK
ncbi:MAG: hypothetical protein EXR98_04360 [Gemmataceae bacterium]|nr:hypothetical protein [Gemmataceae bacterium]